MTSTYQVIRDLNRLMNELTRVDSKRRKVELTRDKAIEAVTARYGPQLEPLVEQQNELIAEITARFAEHRTALLANGDGKRVVLRWGFLQARFSPVAIEVVDKIKAVSSIKRLGLVRKALRQPEVQINKSWLREHLDIARKIKGLEIRQPEMLLIRLARTEQNLTGDLAKHYRSPLDSG